MTARILIIDDEPIAVRNLAYALRKNGYDVTTRESGTGGLEALQTQMFDLILTDLRMERVDGMAILKRALETDPDIAVVLITAHGTLDSAVEAMKAGAFHYVAKPFRLDEVRSIVANALQLVELKRENRRLRSQANSGLHTHAGLVTHNPAMLRLLDTARQVAATDTTVLINGESGTGKELLARYIHQHSRRSAGTFIGVNCGALQEDLLSNELFGHEKGAYTGAGEARAGLIEAANGGTLFSVNSAKCRWRYRSNCWVLQEREVQRLGAQHTTSVDVRDHYPTMICVLTWLPGVSPGFVPGWCGWPLPALRERAMTFRCWRSISCANTLRMGRGGRLPRLPCLRCSATSPRQWRELENLIERGVALARGRELTLLELPAALTDKPSAPCRMCRATCRHWRSVKRNTSATCWNTATATAPGQHKCWGLTGCRCGAS